MKTYLFIINNMHIGGSRSSLINLLKLFRYNEAKAYLYLLSDQGEYIEMIDSRCNLIKTTKLSKCLYSKHDELSLSEKIIRFICFCLKKIFKEEKTLTFFNKKIAKSIEKEATFDVVVSFCEGESLNLAGEIIGKRKYAWIHTNYSNMSGLKAGFDKELIKFKTIFFVANAAKDDFFKNKKKLNCNLDVIPNLIDIETIEKKSNEIVIDKNTSEISIISVGRLSKSKNYIIIPQIAKELVKHNINFKWHIVGEGEEKQTIKDEINKYHMNKYVFLDGAKNNPYPYIKSSDLCVVTSNYESQPMVILESLLLSVPVISTNFNSANELLDNKKYGIICENNVNTISSAILGVLASNNLEEMKKSTADFVYDNESIINRIMNL